MVNVNESLIKIVHKGMNGWISEHDGRILEQDGRIFTNTRIVSGDNKETSLCGFPSFCSLKASEKCYNISLQECDECNMTEAGILTAVYVIMGVLIVVGNGVILWNVFFKRNGFDDTYSKIRGSLAIADMISGLQIFAVILSSLFKTVHFTSNELDEFQASSEGSTSAIIGGVFYLFGFISSLYHLVYLSAQRVYAIALPIRYRLRKTQSTYISLVVIWILSIAASTFPVWFPNHLTFSYYSTIFLYFPSYVTGSQKYYIAAIASLFLLLIYPFAMMTVMSFGTGVMVFCYYKEKKKGLLSSPKSVVKRKKNGIRDRELHVLKLVVFMQIGFTVTLVPLATATSMYYFGYLNCKNFSTPYLVCFVLSICNSLVNVFIYCIFDKKFRASISEAFGRCYTKKIRKKSRDMSVSGSSRNNSSLQASGSTRLLPKQPSIGIKQQNVFSIELQKK